MEIVKSTRKNKKYMAILADNTRVHFGDSRYEQYKDSTPLKLYAHLDHGNKKRRELYFARHSGTRSKADAMQLTTKYTPKYFSHRFLW